MAVGDAYVFPGFLTPALIQLFFPKPPTIFSHPSAEVRGKNTPERKVASTGGRTHNHQVMSSTSSRLSYPGGAIKSWRKRLRMFLKMVDKYMMPRACTATRTRCQKWISTFRYIPVFKQALYDCTRKQINGSETLRYFNSFSAIGEYRYFCGRHRSRSDCTEYAV